MALDEARRRVIEEYDAKETANAARKLKWDAQVRMEQVKRRAAGRALSREETYQLMLNEGIALAVAEVEARFSEMEATRGFGAGKLGGTGTLTPKSVHHCVPQHCVHHCVHHCVGI